MLRCLLLNLFVFVMLAGSPVAKADSLSDGYYWYQYPNDCSLVMANLDTLKSKLLSHNSKSKVDDFRKKCRFYLAGSKVNSAKDKALDALDSATSGIEEAIKNSPVGSFWQGLTK